MLLFLSMISSQRFIIPLCMIGLAACSPQVSDQPDTSLSSASRSVSSERVASAASTQTVRSSSVATESTSDDSSMIEDIVGMIDTFDPLAEHTPPPADQVVQLDVPFTPQAPFANWTDELNEACEEASLLMAEYYLRGQPLSPQLSLDEIEAQIDWQTANGYAWDVTVQELAEVAQQLYGREANVYSGADVTVENIRTLLAAGYPVIIPAAGQWLGNPYFSGDGPPYHMLIITGHKPGGSFRSGRFVVNDPGTRRGEDYEYTEDVIMDSIRNWTGSKDTIADGEVAILVIGE